MGRSLAVCAVLALAASVSVQADTITYTDPAHQGTQAFEGNLALRFDVLSPITVTELGVFNASGSGNIAGTIKVVIYNTITKTQVTPVETFHGAYTPDGLGFDVFQTIAPVVLGVGSYEVDAVGFRATDRNGNLRTGSSSGPVLNNGGGDLAFTGASWDSSKALDDPLTCALCMPVPGQDSQFDAGTFKFEGVASSIPEPSSALLLLTVLVGVALAATTISRFRRRTRNGLNVL